MGYPVGCLFPSRVKAIIVTLQTLLLWEPLLVNNNLLILHQSAVWTILLNNLTTCLSYFSVAVIKCHDQSKLSHFNPHFSGLESITIMGGSMAADRQARSWSSRWEFTSWDIIIRQKDTLKMVLVSWHLKACSHWHNSSNSSSFSQTVQTNWG